MHTSSASALVYSSSEPAVTNNSSGCSNQTPAIFVNVQLVGLSLCLVIVTTTLVLILSHRRLRQQRNIFPFNLLLADVLGVVSYIDDILKQGASPIFWLGFALSIFVSTLSILLVAVYQLITIRIDPFGAKHIITTPRCLAACVATWVLASGLAALVAYFPNDSTREIFNVVIVATVLIVTGICYFLIFRSIARSRPGRTERHDREKENQKVLCTFAMVYGTSFTAWLLAVIFALVRNIVGITCPQLFFVLELMVFVFNWIANTFVYWWRLKEFRSVVLSVIKSFNVSQRIEQAHSREHSLHDL